MNSQTWKNVIVFSLLIGGTSLLYLEIAPSFTWDAIFPFFMFFAVGFLGFLLTKARLVEVVMGVLLGFTMYPITAFTHINLTGRGIVELAEIFFMYFYAPLLLGGVMVFAGVATVRLLTKQKSGSW